MNGESSTGRGELVALTASVVAAYVSHNTVPPGGIAALINEVCVALSAAACGDNSRETREPQKPAVPIRKSVTPDYIICLDDGKRFKSLRRHLRTQLGMTPGEYREKWGLSKDYPMVAPNYAQERSNLAREMGLGKLGLKQQKQRKRVSSSSTPESGVSPSSAVPSASLAVS